MTNWESKNPEMPSAVMAVVDETVDASRAPRDVVMAEVKDVATGVAGVVDLIVVPNVVASARLAVTVLHRTSRASVWMRTVRCCQSPPIWHRMAYQVPILPKLAAAKSLLASAALAVAANVVAGVEAVSAVNARLPSAAAKAR